MKNTRGITLIALVITIIVLLVLAGVSLSLVLGDNGVLNKAQNATTETRNAEEKEKIEMAVAAARAAGDGALTTKNLNDELNKINIDGELREEKEEGWLYSIVDKNYKIYKTGKVEEKDSVILDSYKLSLLCDYRNGINDKVWNSNAGEGINIEFQEAPKVIENEGVNVDMKNENNYATIDVSGHMDLTIYLVAKAIEKNTDHARILELPTIGNSNYRTPSLFVSNGNDNTIGYGIFITDRNTNISAFQYNVIVLRLKSSSNEETGPGNMSIFINGNKQSDLQYQGRGNTIYLGKCNSTSSEISSNGAGNNIYKSVAVYCEAHTDEEILVNNNILTKEYLE